MLMHSSERTVRGRPWGVAIVADSASSPLPGGAPLPLPCCSLDKCKHRALAARAPSGSGCHISARKRESSEPQERAFQTVPWRNVMKEGVGPEKWSSFTSA